MKAKMLTLMSAATIAVGALGISAPASAATTIFEYGFTASTNAGPTPNHSGSFSFSFDDDLLVATLLTIDFQIGATVFDTSNAVVQYRSGGSSNPRFTLGGTESGVDSVGGGDDDFWLNVFTATDTSNDFAYSQVGFSGFGFDPLPNLTLISAAAVPEPATWAMMIAGFGLVGGTIRRRYGKMAIVYA